MEQDEVTETDDEWFERREAIAEAIIATEPTSLREYAETPKYPDEYWGDLDFERYLHTGCSIRAGNFIVNDPWKLAATLRVMGVRCPVRGCFLADCFRFPTGEGSANFLAISNNRRGESKGCFLLWQFSMPRGMMQYLAASCRCGSARLKTFWLLRAAEATCGYYSDVELAIQPMEIQRGVRSGVFIPAPAAWRPKKSSSRPGNVQT
ncbi:hypothetical protein [Pseudonocardia oroxyli]|uniref:Uncharacterized protein n=1 Tax=Pseudonocardia oroxyli TaxID=366584 RepID=A0A1G8CF20_PSEOR|nr:hypothetical protein [Pseudonocardia oroxyli]SDH44084.1 hypothetical protein SAMN05216377_12280 [Pseudonocardia oroxyli]